MLLFGGISFVIMLLHVGFPTPAPIETWIPYLLYGCASAFVLSEMYLAGFRFESIGKYFAGRWLALTISAFLVFQTLLPRIFLDFWSYIIPGISLTNAMIAAYAAPMSLAFLAGLARRTGGLFRSSRIKLSPASIFALGFTIPISLGTLLLKMPNATTEGISWVDALFTATSAVCVTGLIVVDTETAFTSLGHFIIFCLFQIGGLGIVTLTLTFASLLAGGMGIRDRIMMSSILSEESLGAVRAMLFKICAFTFTIEIMGAIGFYLAAGHSLLHFDLLAFYSSLFHAVSAFTNAGFSLYSEGLMSPQIQGGFVYFSIAMVLIVLGSIGFPVLANLWDYLRYLLSFKKKRQAHILTMTTKLVLVATGILLPLGALAIYAVEASQSFSELSTWEGLFHSLFLSVTSRSAGLTSWSTEAISMQTAFIVMALMWIGGAPISTAGGIKATTLLVAFLNIRTQVFGHSRTEIFGREITQHSINRAFAVMSISILLLLVGVVSIRLLEPKLSILDLVFDVVSALGTVGLSRGVTGELSEISKLLLALGMFIGRIGAITLLTLLFKPPQSDHYRLLKERVVVY